MSLDNSDIENSQTDHRIIIRTFRRKITKSTAISRHHINVNTMPKMQNLHKEIFLAFTNYLRIIRHGHTHSDDWDYRHANILAEVASPHEYA